MADRFVKDARRYNDNFVDGATFPKRMREVAQVHTNIGFRDQISMTGFEESDLF